MNKPQDNRSQVSKEYRSEVLADYLLAHQSRQLSITGRKEVFTGKAKFGVFGDGKEVAQIALAKQFRYMFLPKPLS